MTQYCIEAAGDRPLVGEWLAQRKFLMFPRAPAHRDAGWCWMLLKSFVLRRDCMADVKRKPWKRAQQQKTAPSQSPRQRQQQQQNLGRAGATTPQPRGQQQQQQKQRSPGVVSITATRPLPAMEEDERTEQQRRAASSLAHNTRTTTTIAKISTPAPTCAAAAEASSGGETRTQAPSPSSQLRWIGSSPSRNLLFSSAARTNRGQQQQQQQLEYHDNDCEQQMAAARLSDPVSLLVNSKVDPFANPHTAKLRSSVMNVVRRKMWYEQFDRTRREERSALSEKRARAAEAKNTLSEWTWAEDDAIRARKAEQELRDARERQLAQERLLERALRASDSLGIGGPVIVADFSYLKLKYFFELLHARPRNYKFVEDEKHAQLGHKKSKLQKLLDAQRKKNGDGDDAAADGDQQQDRNNASLSPFSVTRNDASTRTTSASDGKERGSNKRPGGASDSIAAAMSTEATFSELLKLYRRHLLGTGAPPMLLDFWKEEDAALFAAAASAAGTASSGGTSSPSSASAPASSSSPSSSATTAGAHQPLQHFPMTADKVSQRFYTRFLRADFGDETLPLNVESAAYAFDAHPPPTIPVMHGLRLRGNRLVDSHVVQCPNGNWRSPPGPVSSFHDFSFVLDVRCPSWRSSLVSLDLSENSFTLLPPEILEIPLLHTLFAHCNRIEKLSDATLVALSAQRGEQLVRLNLYENPVLDTLGHKQYTDRLRNMFPMMSHLDNVYLPPLDLL